jgi:hypothetical protein
VDVVKRLTVTPAGAHQLDNPAGAHPALSNGVSGIACTLRPAHLAAVPVVGIADQHREVPVPAELGHDLLIQPALVVFDRQEQVGALLCGELKNAGEVCSASAWISTPSSSRMLSKVLRAARSWDSPVSNEVWPIAGSAAMSSRKNSRWFAGSHSTGEGGSSSVCSGFQGGRF